MAGLSGLKPGQMGIAGMKRGSRKRPTQSGKSVRNIISRAA